MIHPYQLKPKYLRRLRTDIGIRSRLAAFMEMTTGGVDKWIRLKSYQLTNYTVLQTLAREFKVSDVSELVTFLDNEGREITEAEYWEMKRKELEGS